MRQLGFDFEARPARRRRLVDPVRSRAMREQFESRLKSLLQGRRVEVRFTRNRAVMLSCRRRGDCLSVRLHHMFATAEDRVLVALANHLVGSRRGGSLLDRFIEENRGLIDRCARKAGKTRGRCYDLLRIRDALGRAYFGGPVDVAIEWGQKGRRRRGRQSIRLGSYSFDERLIRIHPLLDDPRVPAYFLVSVVFHEMLHHVLGAEHSGRRRLVHTREFARREKLYVHHTRSLRWERENLEELLR